MIHPVRILFFVSALLLCTSISGTSETLVEFDQNKINQANLQDLADGVFEVRTLGNDAWGITKRLPDDLDLSRDHVLSFEYFSLTETDHIQVFLQPPGTELTSVKSEALSRSEGWSSVGIDLKPALSQHTGKLRTLRIDFGTVANRTIQLRNLRLRPPTEKERAFEMRKAAHRKRELESERLLRGYLDAKYPCAITNVQIDERNVVIEGRISPRMDGLTLVEVPIYAEQTNPEALRGVAAITADENGRFNLATDRFVFESGRMRDRLFSRWAVAKQSGAQSSLVSHVRFCDSVKPKWDTPVQKPRGRKGLGGMTLDRPLSDLDELGISAVTVNILLGSFMRSGPGDGRNEFEYAGKTWYVDEGAVRNLDRTLAEAATRNLIVSAIILVGQASSSRSGEWSQLVAHPDAHPSGHFVMPNVASEEGHAAYAAALDFLARRYSIPNGPHGRIHHWIAHNEVDAGWEWTNAGEKNALLYMDLYHRSMRTIHLIARQYDAHAKVFISLTHYWTQKASRYFYPSRDLLVLLLEFSHREGDFEWAIAHHPYPEDLRNPRTWEDKLARFSFDTPQITFKNIEVLDAWVRQPQCLFNGKTLRTVHLTEQAPNSPDYSEKSLREQAAAMAYLWKKLERLNSIEVFHFHNWVDNRHEGGLRIGLRKFPDDRDEPLGKKPVWYVYKALDTPQAHDATDFAREIVGVNEWPEVQYTGEIE